MQFLDKLQRLRYHFWPVPSMAMPSFSNGSEPIHKISIGAFARVKHLLHAQQQLNGWGSRLKLRCQNELLSDECYLAPLIEEHFAIRIWHNGLPHQMQATRGDFLGLLLEQVGFACPSGPVLVRQEMHWGDRVWQPFSDTFRGAGDGTGLSLDQLLPEIEILLEHTTQWTLFPVEMLADLALKPKVIAGFHIRKFLHSLCQTQGFAPSKIIFALCKDQRWSLALYDVNLGHTRAFDGLQHRHESFHRFLAEICGDLFGHPVVFFPADTLLEQRQDEICGVIMLINLGWQCGLWSDFEYVDALKWYDALSSLTLHAGAGANDFGTAHAYLVNFLPSRGVPQEAVADRAAQAIKKLGLQPILKAISHENPWRQLKSIGSNAPRPFQWVTSDELRQHIASRAGQKHGADTQKKKNKTVDLKLPPQMPISADGLAVPVGTFVDPDGKTLAFIALADLKADCTGITIASLEQVHRFLVDSKVLSTEALGMLTVQRIPDNHPGQLPVEHLTWPATFGNEPLLIRGSLVQLGDRTAALKAGPQVKTTHIDTSLMRFQVYRDQWSADWSLFSKGPLKRLVQTFQQLQVCQQGKGAASCGGDCSRHHPPVDEPTNLVLIDCFAWKWFNADGKGVSPSNSDSFSIMVRTPTSAVKPILELAGRDGFYPELREASGDNTTYAVVWIRGALEDAQYHLRTQAHAMHLTRLFKKYGLRCLKKNEEALRRALFPDEPYVSCKVSLLFQVGPWAHGLSKLAVQEAVVAIPWEAKVLKPCKGNSEGRFWIVGAADHPATNVFQHGSQWVTISFLRDAPEERPTTNVVASLKTIQKLNDFQTAGPADPWMQRDPWQKDPWSSWKPASTGASSSSAPTTRLGDLEASIRAAVLKDVHAQVQAALPGPPDAMEVEPWKAQLESDIVELRHQSSKFNEWFQEAGSKISSMQDTILQHGQSIETLNHNVQQQAQVSVALQQQIVQMDSSLKQELRDVNQQQADRIKEQTEHLEAVFAKRSRHE